jgi:hypothetical protein
MVLWRSEGRWVMFLRTTFVRSTFVQLDVCPTWCLSNVMFVQCDVCPMWYLSDCSVCLTATFVRLWCLSVRDICQTTMFVWIWCLSKCDVCPKSVQSRSDKNRVTMMMTRPQAFSRLAKVCVNKAVEKKENKINNLFREALRVFHSNLLLLNLNNRTRKRKASISKKRMAHSTCGSQQK